MSLFFDSFCSIQFIVDKESIHIREYLLSVVSYPNAEQSVCEIVTDKNPMLMTINDDLYYVLILENRIHWSGYTNVCMSHAKLRLCFSGNDEAHS